MVRNTRHAIISVEIDKTHNLLKTYGELRSDPYHNNLFLETDLL